MKTDPQKINYCVTLTLEQIKNDLQPFVLESIKDLTEEIIENNDYGSHDTLLNLLNFHRWKYSEYFNLWCDIYSDSFFEQNPEIQEILCDVSTTQSLVEKEWLASRE